jgi:2,4-dienoyl-CoA reductase-like NADH-dependent reductase (Old Yellow Enzyme family)/thioredoxin reductase
MKLLEPLTVKGHVIPNRIVMPAMDTNFGDDEGTINPESYDYYELRARGGTGMIIVEAAYFVKRGAGTETMLCIDNDEAIAEFEPIVECIKKHGSVPLLQIYHAGLQSSSFMTGETPQAPSAVVFELSGEVPDPLTNEDIWELVAGYADAAERAQKAGFVGCEVHAGHGYLLNQFLSKLTNLRTDEFGPQSIENRGRMHVEVLRAIRERCGEDFLICFRLNGNDYREGGVQPEDAAQLAVMLENEGVDFIHITGGTFDSPGFPTVPYMNYPKGCFLDAAWTVKQALKKTPLIVVGRINTVEFAEQVLQSGKADLVAMGRALIADPSIGRKAAAGKPETIRVCISCNNCVDRILIEEEVDCAINPDILKDDEDLEPADEPKHVLVVGAGPAGLEAARVCRLRGHRVTLVEQRAKIGGQLQEAAAAPMKIEINNLIRFHEQMINDLGVELRTGEKFTTEMLGELQPDVVLLATGSTPVVPPIKGLAEHGYLMYDRVLIHGVVPEGENIVLIGGGAVGIEVAEMLAHLGKKVTIIEMLKNLAADIEALVRKEVVPLIEGHPNITALMRTTVEEVTATAVIGKNTAGETVEVPYDAIVVAVGVRPFCDVDEDEIAPTGAEVYKIGDCGQKRARNIRLAVHNAYEVSSDI